jgi:predicted transcriptional regulator
MEQQILQLHNQGLNYNQIANTLGCSRSTVRYHIKPQDKADTKTRVELSRANKKKMKQKEKKLRPSLKPIVKEKPKVEVKEPKKKAVKKEKKSDNNKNASDPKKRVFKNRDLGLKEKIAVNLMDSKNTIVYTMPGYDINELREKYLKIKF